MKDAQLIESLGGPAQVARMLRYERGGIQRVHNWLRRGIPARVKLDHPEVFLRSLCIPQPSDASQVASAEVRLGASDVVAACGDEGSSQSVPSTTCGNQQGV